MGFYRSYTLLLEPPVLMRSCGDLCSLSLTVLRVWSKAGRGRSTTTYWEIFEGGGEGVFISGGCYDFVHTCKVLF